MNSAVFQGSINSKQDCKKVLLSFSERVWRRHFMNAAPFTDQFFERKRKSERYFIGKFK
jgi:hypothetical protein